MPNKAPSVCCVPGCPAVACAGGRCAAHRGWAQASSDTHRRSASVRGYGRHWARLRLMHLAREPLCRHCMARGRLTGAAEVDHILPLAQGGTNDDTNLQSLCKRCHSRKTIGETNAKRRVVAGAVRAPCSPMPPAHSTSTPAVSHGDAGGRGGLSFRAFGGDRDGSSAHVAAGFGRGG